jgi:hypothetical protein
MKKLRILTSCVTKYYSRMNPLLICDKLCDQCLYSKNKIVSDKRKEEILTELENTSDYFICHKASVVDKKVMCRGYYEANKHTSLLINLGEDLKLNEFVNVNNILIEGINKTRNNEKSNQQQHR